MPTLDELLNQTRGGNEDEIPTSKPRVRERTTQTKTSPLDALLSKAKDPQTEAEDPATPPKPEQKPETTAKEDFNRVVRDFKNKTFIERMKSGKDLFAPLSRVIKEEISPELEEKGSALEESMRNVPGFRVIPSAVRGVVETPIHQLGEAFSSASEGRVVKTAANTLFAGLGLTPSLAAFNAFVAQPDIEPIFNKVFEEYDKIKTATSELPLISQASQSLEVTKIGREVKDLVDVATDILPFAVMHRTLFGKGKTKAESEKPVKPKVIKKEKTTKALKDASKDQLPLGEKSWADFKKENKLKKSIKDYFGEDNLVVEGVKDMYNKAINTRYIEKKFGVEGKQIAESVHRADRAATLGKARDLPAIAEKFNSLKESELKNFVDVSEGKAKPISQGVADAFAEWDRIRTNFAKRAENAGLRIKDSKGEYKNFVPRKDYFPRMVTEERLAEVRANGRTLENFLQDMVTTSKGRIKNVAEANAIFKKFINDRLTGKYGHLERAREALLPTYMFEKDPRIVLRRYIDKAHERLADAEMFGPEYQKTGALVEQVRQRGGDYEVLQQVFDRAVGREIFDPKVVKVSRAIAAWQVVTKLGFAQITNLADAIKPFIRTNTSSAIMGMVESFKKEGKRNAERSGVIAENLRQMEKNIGVEAGFTDKFMKATGFEAVEKQVRRIGVNAGRNYAGVLFNKLKKDPSNKFARRRLEQFNIDVDAAIKRGKLSEKDLIKAGFQAVADTQPVGRLDVPFYWQSPGGRIITQFKSFAVKQMQFIDKFIWKELKAGNPRPIMTFLIMGQLIGEPVADLKAFVRGRKRDDDLYRRMIDNYMTVGGMGLVTDFMSNIQYGQFGGGFLKFLAGPTLGEMDEVLTILASPNKGEKITKTGIRKIPVIGQTLSNLLFPRKHVYRARTIPIAEDIIKLIKD